VEGVEHGITRHEMPGHECKKIPTLSLSPAKRSLGEEGVFDIQGDPAGVKQQ